MENQEIPNKKSNNISVANAIIVAGLLIAGSVFFYSFKKDNDKLPKTNNIAIAEVTEKDFIMGDPNAKITLVEYADFSCGFCAKYHVTMKRIMKDYNGKVKWVFRHLPIFNKPAAVASSCVGNILGDEKFFIFSDNLFMNQKNINQELMKKEALNLGINEKEYEDCINDFAINNKISRDFNSVRILAGFNSTPFTVIIDENGNMYPFSGALSYEEVSLLIDSFID